MAGDRTIFALSSGAGMAGVAVIRVSGPATAPAFKALGAGGLTPRMAGLRTLRDPDTGEALDAALCLCFPAPHSFTGEDAGELHVHGGRAVIDAVLGALARLPDLAPAEPGEFTRRAFENNRLDLTGVEGLADLVAAQTAAQRRQALRQAGGALGGLYEGWRQRLIRAMAHLEADIDFADEGDVGGDEFAKARPVLTALAGEIVAHVAQGNRGERLRDGFSVVIAGPPNAGKSSLLNRLARRDAAIVSRLPGTTRDAIEVQLDLDGFPVVLTDTAGLRAAGDEIEMQGVARARARIAAADLVLWLGDAHAPDEPGDQPPACGEAPALRLVNKIDLIAAAELKALKAKTAGALFLSAVTGDGLDGLTAEIAARAAAALGGEALVPTRLRHRAALDACRTHLARALEEKPGESELIAESLRLAARELGRITGRVDVEDLLDVIFRDFCIGK